MKTITNFVIIFGFAWNLMMLVSKNGSDIATVSDIKHATLALMAAYLWSNEA